MLLQNIILVENQIKIGLFIQKYNIRKYISSWLHQHEPQFHNEYNIC